MTETTDRTDLFGGIALGIAALAALGIANSALAPYYDALIHVLHVRPISRRRPR
jgi:Na+/H+ antiporter NhaA